MAHIGESTPTALPIRSDGRHTKQKLAIALSWISTFLKSADQYQVSESLKHPQRLRFCSLTTRTGLCASVKLRRAIWAIGASASDSSDAQHLVVLAF